MQKVFFLYFLFLIKKTIFFKTFPLANRVIAYPSTLNFVIFKIRVLCFKLLIEMLDRYAIRFEMLDTSEFIINWKQKV